MEQGSDTPQADLDRAREYASQLAQIGLLTEQQARAWAFRRAADVDLPVSVAAEEMGVTESRVYNASADAEAKLEAARETLALVDELREGDSTGGP